MVQPFKLFQQLIFKKNARFHELGYANALLEDEIVSGIKKVLKTTSFGELEQLVNCFEKEFAVCVHAKYALGVNSGTSALYYALKVFDIGPGDEVITVANTFISTITAIRETGAECCFVDIDEATGLMDYTKLEQKITKNTKAIIPVHMYGMSANLSEICKIAKKNNLFVIEDACQAIGASFQGKSVGAWGDVSVFSFHMTKLVGAPGDGGMLVTQKKEIHDKLRKIVLPDWDNALTSTQIRMPSRLSPLMVPVLSAKLKRLQNKVSTRCTQYKFYEHAFSNKQELRLLKPSSKTESSYRNCILVSDSIGKIKKNLSKASIPYDIIYQPSEKFLNKHSLNVELPVTYNLIRNHIALPVGDHLEKDLLESVTKIVLSVI